MGITLPAPGAPVSNIPRGGVTPIDLNMAG
jgi:hypothetical protein